MVYDVREPLSNVRSTIFSASENRCATSEPSSLINTGVERISTKQLMIPLSTWMLCALHSFNQRCAHFVFILLQKLLYQAVLINKLLERKPH